LDGLPVEMFKLCWIVKSGGDFGGADGRG